MPTNPYGLPDGVEFDHARAAGPTDYEISRSADGNFSIYLGERPGAAGSFCVKPAEGYEFVAVDREVMADIRSGPGSVAYGRPRFVAVKKMEPKDISIAAVFKVGNQVAEDAVRAAWENLRTLAGFDGQSSSIKEESRPVTVEPPIQAA